MINGNSQVDFASSKTAKPRFESQVNRNSQVPRQFPQQPITIDNNSLTIPPSKAKNMTITISTYHKETKSKSPYRFSLDKAGSNNSFVNQPGYSSYRQSTPSPINKKPTEKPPSNFSISASEFLRHANSLYQNPTNKENLYATKYQDARFQARSGKDSTFSTKTNREKNDSYGDIAIKMEEGFELKPKTSERKLVNLVIMEEQEEMARVHKQYVESMGDLGRKVKGNSVVCSNFFKNRKQLY